MTGISELTNTRSSSYIRQPLREAIEANHLSNQTLNEVHRLFHALKEVQSSSVQLERLRPSQDKPGFVKNLLIQGVHAISSIRIDDLIRNIAGDSTQKPAALRSHADAGPGDQTRDAAAGGLFSYFRDPLVFPGAAADLAYSAHAPEQLSPDVHFFAFNSSEENSLFALLDGVGADRSGADSYAEQPEIKKLLAEKELMMVFLPHGISKRAALNRMPGEMATEAQNQYHNCKIRTKTNAGTPIGDSVLVAGEYLRNPLRGAVEQIKETLLPGHPMTETEVTMTEVGNTVHDVILGFITLGAYPIFKYGSAKALNVAGHAANGDRHCIKQEFSAEQMAQLLFDTETGITNTGVRYNVPSRLNKATPFKPNGLFVQEHLSTGVHTEKYMTIRRNGEDVMIREKTAGQYVTHHPHATHPERLEQRVFFDQKTQKIFFDRQLPEGGGYDFNIIDGKKFISLHGQNRELVYNWNTQRPEIKIEIDGKAETLPVYMEKLSHTWHLNAQDGRPVFDGERKKMIDRIKIDSSAGHIYHPADNLNPAAYGSGKIYEVRRQNEFLSNAPFMHVLEMNGELVPARLKVMPEQGVRYEVYDPAFSGKAGRPVEWSNGRWIFEHGTSVHVSQSLKNTVDKSMFKKDVNPADLSAPDRRGLQRDSNNNLYLKIKNHFVQLHRYVSHPNTLNRYYIKKENGETLALRFRGNKFHKENLNERLSNLRQAGLGGRRFSAQDWLVEYHGIDNEASRTWARNLLSEYEFPTNSPTSDTEFARHFFEWGGTLPQWAGKYRVAPPGACRVKVKDVAGNEASLSYWYKDLLGEGVDGCVYPDANDANYVVKEFHADQDEMDLITEAGESFSRFYGSGASQVFQGENNIFMRMKKIDGKPLDKVDAFPSDAGAKFEAMLNKLADSGIYHSDLKPDNILWDDAKKVFNPIDFRIDPEESLHGLDAEDLFDRMRFNTEDVMALINSKIVPA